MNQHTVKAYGDELNQLTAEVARMGGLAEAQVADAVESVARRDIALARAVVERDVKLDAMHRDIEKKAIRLIALRQPVASDLRKTLAAMKLGTDLERTGDLAKNIAKRALSLAETEPMQPLTRSIERMGKLVSMRLRDVLDAYTASEIDRAMAVWASDDEVDEHYNALFRELLTYMMGDPRTISACTHLLFMAKNLERIGDHATNIAEVIHYEITGDEMTGERPDGRPRRATGTPTAATCRRPPRRWQRLTDRRADHAALYPGDGRRGRPVDLASVQPRKGGLRCRRRRRRRGGARPDRRAPAGSGSARLDASQGLGHRGLPSPEGPSRDAQPAGHHADGARRGDRTACVAWTPVPTTI